MHKNLLQNECIKKADEAVEKLRGIYNFEEYIPLKEDCKDINKKTKWRYRFLFNFKIADRNISLILCLPKAFPYDFPKIFLHSSHKDLYEKIPHIDQDLGMCIYDKNEVNPCPEKAFELIKTTLNKGIEIIETAFQNGNLEDFKDEIQAYWNIDHNYRILSILDEFEPNKEIVAANLTELRKIYNKNNQNNVEMRYNLNKIAPYSYVLANDICSLTNYLTNLGIKITKEDYKLVVSKSLFIILEDTGYPPFPNNNKKLFDFLEKYSPKSLPYIKAFLRSNKRPILIVFGYKNKKRWLLGAWKYNEFIFKHKIGKKEKITYDFKGFRKNNQPIAIELNSSDTLITRYSLERLDKNRLYKRGGNNNSIDKLYKINLVGCGSIGSFLAEDLVKIGFNSFVFLDEEVLGTENLARHYCDMKYLYKLKSVSLKKALTEKYPFLDITTEECNLSHMLIENIEFFNCADLTILAIADFKTELLLNKAYKLNLIEKPILIIWVEPYLNTGNAVLLMPKKRGCLKCLFDMNSGKFLYARFKPKSFTLSREFGCQSTYLEYGSNDIAMFTNYIARIVYKIYKKKYNDNYLFQIVKESDNLNFKVISSKFKKLENIHFCCEGK